MVLNLQHEGLTQDVGCTTSAGGNRCFKGSNVGGHLPIPGGQKQWSRGSARWRHVDSLPAVRTQRICRSGGGGGGAAEGKRAAWQASPLTSLIEHWACPFRLPGLQASAGSLLHTLLPLGPLPSPPSARGSNHGCACCGEASQRPPAARGKRLGRTRCVPRRNAACGEPAPRTPTPRTSGCIFVCPRCPRRGLLSCSVPRRRRRQQAAPVPRAPRCCWAGLLRLRRC